MAPKPIAEGLFVEREDGPRLIAARRRSDGRMRFPMPEGPEASLYVAVELPPHGRLWSFTVQRFRPKTPYARADDEGSFRPYPVGYVEFEGQVIVEGRILADDPARLAIGQAMQVALEPFPTSDHGELATYAFRPAE